MKLRRIALSASALALAGVGTFAGVAASSASAAPPVHHTIVATSLQTSATHLGPDITINRYAEFTPTATAPGFANTSNVVEVCVNVPHVTPPVASTVLAVCNWRLTTTGPLPHSSLSGRSVLTGVRQVGRVTNGTGIWNHAFSLLPNQTTFTNIAPRTQTDTFNFFTP